MEKTGYWAVLPASVRHDRRLTQTAKLLYAEISGLAQADGYCWATDKWFSELFGCSVATITRALRSLVQGGYIRIERSANAKGTERHIYAGLDPGRGGIVKNDDTVEGIVKNDETPIVKNDETPPATHIKTENKKSDTGARAREEDEVDRVLDGFAGDDATLRDALADFREDRRRRKKPMRTALAASRLCSKLQRLSRGDRAVMCAMLDKAIERGWDSVYELAPDELPKTVPRGVEEAGDVIDFDEWEAGAS